MFARVTSGHRRQFLFYEPIKASVPRHANEDFRNRNDPSWDGFLPASVRGNNNEGIKYSQQMKNNNISIVHIALSKERNGLIAGIDRLAGTGRSSQSPPKDPQ